MSLDINIADEFSRVLNLPITPEEARRYKENLLRQNPGSNIMNISDLYSIGDRQAITFTPSQIHQLWFKSEYLKGIDPSKYSRRQELSELLSVALLAEYLNMIYTLNIPEIPGSTFNATLFNIQAVPKPETKPDVYLHNRSHRNHLIPNIGFAENNRIEVLEYETYRYSQNNPIYRWKLILQIT